MKFNIKLIINSILPYILTIKASNKKITIYERKKAKENKEKERKAKQNKKRKEV